MSAVENVEARIARLQQTLDAKCAELHVLQTRQRYNATLGIDEDLATGQSVATLEVKVVGGRNMLYNSGFLSVMQEERLGHDLLVGSLQIPLLHLQDQRLLEKWHVLSKENQASASELLLCCRFNRSKISAIELDVELLQNQLRELHTFLERQRQFTNQTFSSSERFVPVNHLKGKEVSVQATVQRAHSTRFDAVATFPFQAARKREFVDTPMTSSEPLASDLHRAKRQRTSASDPGPAPTSVTFTEKLANWLLPSSSASSSPSVAPRPFGAVPVSQGQVSYPFKQQPVEKKRTKKSVRPKLQKTPSMLQSFEQWLFTEPENSIPN
uniref:Uncharacterized protein n=1 Tax=Globisporangium ultimum (strain ATCC 200006 / CBS 805.95 / DAOM BR144) TaxID=431595 RepID=K3W9N0_GLOUD